MQINPSYLFNAKARLSYIFVKTQMDFFYKFQAATIIKESSFHTLNLMLINFYDPPRQFFDLYEI